VFDFIAICTHTYHLIFADPPYDLNQLEMLPNKIDMSRLLRPGGIFILEHSGAFDFLGVQGYYRMRKYGNVHFSFFSFDHLQK